MDHFDLGLVVLGHFKSPFGLFWVTLGQFKSSCMSFRINSGFVLDCFGLFWVSLGLVLGPFTSFCVVWLLLDRFRSFLIVLDCFESL